MELSHLPTCLQTCRLTQIRTRRLLDGVVTSVHGEGGAEAGVQHEGDHDVGGVRRLDLELDLLWFVGWLAGGENTVPDRQQIDRRST